MVLALWHVGAREGFQISNQSLAVPLHLRIATLFQCVELVHQVRHRFHLAHLEHVPAEHLRAEDRQVQAPLIAAQVAVGVETAGGLVILDPQPVQHVQLAGDGDAAVLPRRAHLADRGQRELDIDLDDELEALRFGGRQIARAGMLQHVVERRAGAHGLRWVVIPQPVQEYRQLGLVILAELPKRFDFGYTEQHHAACCCSTYSPAFLSKANPRSVAALLNRACAAFGASLIASSVSLKSDSAARSPMVKRHFSMTACASRCSSVSALRRSLICCTTPARNSANSGASLCGIGSGSSWPGFFPNAASVGEKFSTRVPSRMAMRPIASAAL